jgi:hypothetical protein
VRRRDSTTLHRAAGRMPSLEAQPSGLSREVLIDAILEFLADQFSVAHLSAQGSTSAAVARFPILCGSIQG